MKKYGIILIGIWVLTSGQAHAQRNWSIEFSGGGAYCIQTPLTIQQSGHDNIEVSAQYHTHSLTPPLYYAIRLGTWQSNRGWELELIHLKLDLANAPDEVQRFEISHGYNMLTLNRAWMRPYYAFRLGAGAIIAHPENTVRAQSLDEHDGIMKTGYYLAGPTAQAAMSKSFSVTPHLSIAIEGKLTGSYARIPVVDGHATVSNIAIHALIGIGYTF
jgi:hypothetical protein